MHKPHKECECNACLLNKLGQLTWDIQVLSEENEGPEDDILIEKKVSKQREIIARLEELNSWGTRNNTSCKCC